MSFTAQKRKIPHPCFESSCTLGRIHLPVAPRCNLQCGYCSRKYDCVNESRPGVTSRIMTPEEACEYYREKSQLFRFSVVGIAGPGDPLANWAETERTLKLIRNEAPNINLCISTNGLTGAQYAQALYTLGVQFITLTINAIDEPCVAELYDWVTNDNSHLLSGLQGGRFLLGRQTEALRAFSNLGFHIKINTVVVPGVNEHQIGKIARFAARFGCDLINLIPLIPVNGTRFASKASPSVESMEQCRRAASVWLPVMQHCQHCRADAAGYLTRETR